MLEKEVSTNPRNHTVRIFWGRDMTVFLEGAESTSLIAQVNERGAIDWDADGLRLIGCTNENAVKLKTTVASQRKRR